MAKHTVRQEHSDSARWHQTRRDIAALTAMTTGELAAKYLTVFGIPTRTRNKEYLRRHLAWRLQAQHEGIELSPRAVDQISGLAPQAPVRWRAPAPSLDHGESESESESERATAPRVGRRRRSPRAMDLLPAKTRRKAKRRDPRLPPPGTAVTRIYDGMAHEVTVGVDSFEFRGIAYRSLSKIAKLITRKDWNGFRFFFGNTGRHSAGDTK